MTNQDQQFLSLAIEKARESVAKGGFPAGAVVVKDNQVIGSGISLAIISHDPTNHAETAAIREAAQNLKSADLSGAVLYASMQPCLLCFGSTLWAGISKIVYACPQAKVTKDYYGGEYSTIDISKQLIHPIELAHVPELEQESMSVVREWESKQK